MRAKMICKQRGWVLSREMDKFLKYFVNKYERRSDYEKEKIKRV